MGVYEQTKPSLSPLDTKKWIAPDGVTTRAFGHYLTSLKDAAKMKKTRLEDAAKMEEYLNKLLAE